MTDTYLIKGDLFIIPVLNVEEKYHAAVFVPAGEDAGVACFNGAPHSLRGQVLKQLGVVTPEAHIT